MDHQLFLEAFASLGPLVSVYKLPDLIESINEDNNSFYNDNNNNNNNDKNKKMNSIHNKIITRITG